MSPLKQNVTIAKACGWEFIADYSHGKDQPPEYTTVTPEGKHLCGYYPDYFNDLNEIHEAVKSLPQNLKPRYFAYLCAIVSGAISLHGYAEATEATAAQRCEAFLKTIGKWVTA